jgi:hypothetical protein
VEDDVAATCGALEPCRLEYVARSERDVRTAEQASARRIPHECAHTPALALQTRNEMHSHEARRASHEGRRHRLHGEGKHGDVDATLHRTGLAAVRLALIGPACDERGAGLHLATDHRERDGAEPR